MRGGRWFRTMTALAVVAVLTAVGVARAEAQWRDDRPVERAPKAWFGLSFIAADPVGDFGQLVNDGFGGQLEGRFPLAASGLVSLRLDGGFLIYGHERQRMCFSLPVGCRIAVDLTTTNTIAFAGVGPELAIPGPVSPYVNGSVGISYFGTHSSLSGADDFDQEFTTRNYSDLVTAARLGGGLRLRVGGTRRGPVVLDLGAEYHKNGIAEYLREGDIVDYPDGSIALFPNRTEANLVTFKVGVTFGLGGGYDDDRGHPGHRDRSRRR